jgi:hypothetical protein
MDTLRLTLVAVTLLSLIGCSVSGNDKQAYEKEIRVAQGIRGEGSEAIDRTLLRGETAPLAGWELDNAEREVDKSLAYLRYESCLLRRQKAGEEFAMAKPKCALQADVPLSPD